MSCCQPCRWTKGSYYLSLNDSIGASYLDPEFYIGTSDPRVFSLWQSQNNMYHRNYLPRCAPLLAPFAATMALH